MSAFATASAQVNHTHDSTAGGKRSSGTVTVAGNAACRGKLSQRRAEAAIPQADRVETGCELEQLLADTVEPGAQLTRRARGLQLAGRGREQRIDLRAQIGAEASALRVGRVEQAARRRDHVVHPLAHVGLEARVGDGQAEHRGGAVDQRPVREDRPVVDQQRHGLPGRCHRGDDARAVGWQLDRATEFVDCRRVEDVGDIEHRIADGARKPLSDRAVASQIHDEAGDAPGRPACGAQVGGDRDAREDEHDLVGEQDVLRTESAGRQHRADAARGEQRHEAAATHDAGRREPAHRHGGDEPEGEGERPVGERARIRQRHGRAGRRRHEPAGRIGEQQMRERAAVQEDEARVDGARQPRDPERGREQRAAPRAGRPPQHRGDRDPDGSDEQV